MNDALSSDRKLGFGRFAAPWKEFMALAKHAALFPRDITAPVIPVEARDGDDVVILLHGLFSSAGALRPLRSAIASYAAQVRGAEAQRAVHTAALSSAPGFGVEALAERLSTLAAALPKGARLHLVGHSLGGVVCRYFALESADPRIVQTISMGSPFRGFSGIEKFDFGLMRDLKSTSPLLERIRSGPRHASIPHLSLIAGADAVVRPPLEHALPGGDTVCFEGLGHNTMLFDSAAATTIAWRVTSWRPEARVTKARRRVRLAPACTSASLEAALAEVA